MSDMEGLPVAQPQVRAVAVFNGDGGTVAIISLWNVKTVVRISQGKFRITFVDPMPSRNYLVLSANGGASGFTFAGSRTPDDVKTETTLTIETSSPSGGADVDPHDVQLVVMA